MIKSLTTLTLISTLALAATAAEDVFQRSGGEAPSRQLKIKKSKVPQFEIALARGKKYKFKKQILNLKELPALDVGEEAQLSYKDLIINIAPEPLQKPTIPKAQPLVAIKTIKSQNYKTQPVQPPRDLLKLVAAPNPQNTKVPEYPAVPTPEARETNPQPKNIIVLSDSDKKLLQALIFLDIHKNYELAMGLFADLLKEKKHIWQATYLMGLTASGLKLHTESEHHMLTLVRKDNKEYIKHALTHLVNTMKTTEQSLALEIEGDVDRFNIENDQMGGYPISLAKGHMDNKNLSKALAALDQLPEKSPYKLEGQFLKALIEYRSNQINDAIKTLSQLVPQLEQTTYDWDLKSLAAMTLARLYFQKNLYKEAFANYLKLEKNHPLWLQSLVEQSWTQILSGDHEGAAGNMFSLHTDFFKGAYQPESYVVRTVGYLNLCQFGDALAVLREFHRKYTYVYTRVQDYQKQHKNELDYYETVKSFLKMPSQREIDGLPRSLVVEMARHPDFLAFQREINELEDESIRYVDVSKTILEQEKKFAQLIEATKEKIRDLQEKVSKTKHEETLVKQKQDLEYQKRRLISFELQYQVAKRARNSVKEVRESALARIEKMKTGIRAKGSKILKVRLANVEKELKGLIDQQDLLQYEIFSGAGEHIRYQMAGGEIEGKGKVELKPDEGKSMKWGFKGEIWEDEIGHYRSSLKNVCPKEEQGKAVR